jgi:hypothetical protein
VKHLDPGARVRVKADHDKGRIGSIDARQGGVYRVKFADGSTTLATRSGLALQTAPKAPS